MKQTVPARESRWKVLGLFTASLLGASLFMMSTGTLVPFFETAFHIGGAQLGLVLSVQMVGAIFTTALGGMLTDRFGDKAVVLWNGFFMGACLILAGLIPNFTWLLFWLLLYGIGYSAVTPTGSHAIIHFFKKDDRGLAMGLQQCGAPIAGVLGALLLPALALHFGYPWALATAGIITIVACTTASMFYREPAELQGEHVRVRDMLFEMLVISRDIRLVLLTLTEIALVCAQVVFMAFFTITLVHEASYAIPFAVTIFALAQAAAIAGGLFWGWASDHIFHGSRALPLAVTCVVVCLAALAASLITPSMPVLLVALIAAVLGFSAEGWLGVGVIAIAEIGGEEHAGSWLGVGYTWMFVAAFIAPTIFGAIAESRGYSSVWRALAFMTLLGVVPAILASVVIRRALATANAQGL